MPIKQWLIFGFLLVALLFGSSCGKETKEVHGENAKKETETGIAQVSSFAIPIPAGWEEKGNKDKLYEEEVQALTFLLIGAEGSLEEALPQDLALFFSTGFYANQTEVVPEDGKENLQSGRIENGRLNETWYYCGFNLENERGFFVYVAKDPGEKERLIQYAETSYQGLARF
jgi:hypothetical protein